MSLVGKGHLADQSRVAREAGGATLDRLLRRKPGPQRHGHEGEETFAPEPLRLEDHREDEVVHDEEHERVNERPREPRDAAEVPGEELASQEVRKQRAPADAADASGRGTATRGGNRCHACPGHPRMRVFRAYFAVDDAGWRAASCARRSTSGSTLGTSASMASPLAAVLGSARIAAKAASRFSLTNRCRNSARISSRASAYGCGVAGRLPSSLMMCQPKADRTGAKDPPASPAQRQRHRKPDPSAFR